MWRGRAADGERFCQDGVLRPSGEQRVEVDRMRTPPDYLKVDSSLVADLGRRADDQALVEGMTSMAHALA